MQDAECANCPAALLQVSQDNPLKRDGPKHNNPGRLLNAGTELSFSSLAVLHDMSVGYLDFIAGTNLSGNRDSPPGWFFTRVFITVLKVEKHLCTFSFPSHAIQIMQPLVIIKQIARGQISLWCFCYLILLVNGQNTACLYSIFFTV